MSKRCRKSLPTPAHRAIYPVPVGAAGRARKVALSSYPLGGGPAQGPAGLTYQAILNWYGNPQLCGRHSDGRKFLLTDPRARSTVRAPLRRDLPRSLKTESYPARNRAGPERLLVSKLAGSSETNNMAAHLRRVVSVGVSNQAPHGNVSAEGFKLESLILAQNER